MQNKTIKPAVYTVPLFKLSFQKLYYLIFLSFTILIISLISCNNDNSISPNGNQRYIDPTILRTDSIGNILGGDTTDWCYRGGNEFTFNPVYPNPVIDTFHHKMTLTMNDTISLFFINSPNDTLFLLKNTYRKIGMYDMSVSLNFHIVTKRLYLKTTHIYNNNNSCKFYGDIQFY